MACQSCHGSEPDWLKERDAKIASFNAQLSLKEVEATKAIRLRGQVAIVEAAKAAWASDLNGLKERNAVLEGQVAALESTAGICSGFRDEVMGYKLFKEQIKAVQDMKVKVLSNRVAELDVNLMGMDLHLDEEYYPCYLTTIDGRRWILSRGLKLVVIKCLQSPEYVAALGGAIGRDIDKGIHVGLVSGIDHGKAGRDLTDVAAYDPSAEANYMSAMSTLRPVAKTPEAIQLQPSPKQLMLPIHRLKDQVVIGETSLFFSLDVANVRVQRLKRNVASQHLSISDALVPLIKPLSAKKLVGEASTSEVPATTTTTALSIPFIQANTVPPIPVTDHEVLTWGHLLKFLLPQRLFLRRRCWRLRQSMVRPTKSSVCCCNSIFVLRSHVTFL
ncbi:hypothetical protein Tco_0672115 [Tanacetum coccineum]